MNNKKVYNLISTKNFSQIFFKNNKYINSKLFKTTQNFNKIQKMNFRDWRKNDLVFSTDNRYAGGKIPSPYQPQFTLNEDEMAANDLLPVTDRILDYRKYMQHKGQLKYSTGLYVQDVEPFPRLKIMMICHVILNLLTEFDNSFLYKLAVKESITFIMEVVDQNDVLNNIENALITFQSMENLIIKLDDEVTLLRYFLKNDSYKKLQEEDDDKEFFKTMFFHAAFTDVPIKDRSEQTTHRKHEKPERPKTYFSEEEMITGKI